MRMESTLVSLPCELCACQNFMTSSVPHNRLLRLPLPSSSSYFQLGVGERETESLGTEKSTPRNPLSSLQVRPRGLSRRDPAQPLFTLCLPPPFSLLPRGSSPSIVFSVSTVLTCLLPTYPPTYSSRTDFSHSSPPLLQIIADLSSCPLPWRFLQICGLEAFCAYRSLIATLPRVTFFSLRPPLAGSEDRALPRILPTVRRSGSGVTCSLVRLFADFLMFITFSSSIPSNHRAICLSPNIMPGTTIRKRTNVLLAQLYELQRFDLEFPGPLCLQTKFLLKHSSYCTNVEIIGGLDSAPAAHPGLTTLSDFFRSQLDAQKLTNRSEPQVTVTQLLDFILGAIPARLSKKAVSPAFFYWYCPRRHRTYFVFAFVDRNLDMSSRASYTIQELLSLRTRKAVPSLATIAEKRQEFREFRLITPVSQCTV